MISQILLLPEVEALRCSSAKLIAKGKTTKPDIFRLEFNGFPSAVIFKTYALKNVFVRATLGWFVTRREYAMLQVLKGIEGIVQSAYPPSRYGLFLHQVPGKPLNKFSKESLPEEVFVKLATLVKQMHHAGVVHLDIAHKGNILVTPDGSPVLIDFQSALYVKRWPSWIRKLLFMVDEFTVLKWKIMRFPHLITPEDEQAYVLRSKLARWWPWSHGRSKKKRVL